MPKSFPAPTVTVVNKPLLVKGSIPYWDQENALDSFKKNIGIFNYINLFWYYLSPNGDVNKYEYADEDSSIIEFAHQSNVKVSAVITNLPEYSGATWDSKRVEDVIENDNLRKNHIQNIVQKLIDLNFNGVIIDYEQVNKNVKTEFSAFISELYAVLHENGKELVVVLHPRSGDKIRGEENGWFQDWKSLSLYADQLQIMGYGEHWDESGPGPIASVLWLERILNYAKSIDIPKEKVFLGIPLYGYDWDTTSGGNATDLTYQDVEKLLLDFNIQEIWDDKSQSAYFNYLDKNNHTHEVWFENQRSIEAKINIAKSYGLLGITFWRLGEEDPRVWDVFGDPQAKEL